jgi:hypothetical protein
MLLWISNARDNSRTQRKLLALLAVLRPRTSHYHRLHPS